MAVVCVDIGKTHSRFAVHTGVFETIEKIPSNNLRTDSPTQFVELLREQIKSTVHASSIEMDHIESVGIASPAPINRESKTAYFLHEKPVSLRDLTDIGDVYLDNDATLGVIGEYVVTDSDVEDIIYVVIGTGIGSGIILNGHVINGWKGNAGEIGHLKMTNCKIECPWCDGIGHWMAACSGSQLPILANVVGSIDVKCAEELFSKYNEGDRKAAKVLNVMHSYNAEAFTQIINFVNPERIVVGGGVTLNNPEIVREAEQRIDAGCFNTKPAFSLPEHGDEITLHGLKAVCKNDIEYSPVVYHRM